MTLTSKTMNWLNQNRRRSYPVRRDEWREKVSPASGLDGVLLDASVFNNDADGSEEFSIAGVSVSPDRTRVSMKYGETEFSVALSGGGVSGEESFDVRRGALPGEARTVTVSLVFSSHAYILSTLGEGTWDLGCRMLQSRVANLSDGFGVDGVSVNGSVCVPGHESPAVASGDVVLEDGYRTSPVIHRGKVIVRVGRKYGKNPCHYECGDVNATDCRIPMFFFCGQNAINGGNVVLSGGRGISVTQGRTYTVKTGRLAGRSIPCIEIAASSELMDAYHPHDGLSAAD